ncbi:hypothetical protein TNCV_1230241 [Trichonephila clavipes]|nr:hypothetical protein TNCV_1230241 [Trichonephila clavipes]
MQSLFPQKTGQCERSPTTKNCAPQASAICGSGERQPPRVQWMASARGSLPCDQGIPNASWRERSPTTKIVHPKQPLFVEVANVNHPECNGWPLLGEAFHVIKAFPKPGQRERSPNTKNCAPQATAICGSGERQPPPVQWMASARGSLLCDQGIPSASPTTKNCAPRATAICGSGERQPPRVQWMASARGSLLCDQGIPSARFSPRRAHTLGDKPKKRQARMRWRQVNIAGQGGS